jgi:hypothetical protein
MLQHLTMRRVQMAPPALRLSADFIAFVSGATVSKGKAHGNFTGAWPANAQVALLPGTAGLSKSATGNFLRLVSACAQPPGFFSTAESCIGEFCR